MDDCPANNKSVSESGGGFCASSKPTLDCAFGDIEGLSADDLGHHFTDKCNIRDGKDPNDYEKSKEGVRKDSHGSDSGNVASTKCLIKSATFPCSGMSMPPAKFGWEEQDNDVATEVIKLGADAKSPDLPCSRSISLPTPLKLVSAMKGSREKQGKLRMKPTVTWAPDVYDPVPTAVSHAPNTGQSNKSGKKKNGKNKQKNSGKSSRGSKGKDKKQARKNGVSSPINIHPLAGDSNSNLIASSREVQSNIVDFDIGSPDPFCGSSFLKKSIAKLHFPVAEAT